MKAFFSTFICLNVSTLMLMAAPKKVESIFDLWDDSSNTSIEFRVNFDSLEAHRKAEGFFPATIIEDGKIFELEVAVRGRFRRRTCAMPPMKLKFKKDILRAAGLNTHNDFKLVTHCTDDAAGQDALLREQLAYELYNTVNPNASFRTQLLTINYVNTADGSTTTSYAILIEDTDELQDRMQGDNCKDCYNAPLSEYNNAEEVALFQQMIGNNDYCTKMIRNMKAMRMEDGTLTAVPYDFDFCGMVSPSYITVNATERHLKWNFSEAGDFSEASAKMLSLKDQLLDQVDTFEVMDGKSRKEISRYMKVFFRSL